MDAFGVRPDGDPAQQRLLLDARSRLADGVIDRERTVELGAAVLFLLAAVGLIAATDSSRELNLPLAAGLVVAYALATRIEFRIAVGWTDPSQLVFVPMLFLLPTDAVPLLVAIALLAARVPEYMTGRVHVGRAMLRVADASYSLWPALVLIAFDATIPAWGDWPVYLVALAAQFGLDGLVTMFRARFGGGLESREVFQSLVAVDRVDAMLSSAGLLAAFGAAAQPGTSLLIVPLLGVFWIFAREREARIESALTLSSAYRGTALLLSEVLTSTDEYTGHHSRSVVVLAHQVGEALGLDEATMRDIEFGALLHDVGKMSVPHEILNKPGPLTDAEMDVMRQHTIEGEGMLARIGGALEQAGVAVRSHHERYDGNGYPDGLIGAQIPIAARVIAVCDAYNAMTTDRPYRGAMPADEAIAELRREAGRQFDPRVVDAVVAIVETWDREPVAA